MTGASDAASLTRQLVRQNTINPPGDEAAAIAIVGGLLEDAGFATRLVELAPGRPNLIARIAGREAEAPALGFTGHLDVVPLGQAPWVVDPFAGEADGDRLFGRGTSDMKAGVAAMVLAACRVARQPGRRAGLELVLTAGEETGCAGAREVVGTPGVLGRVGALVVGEPTGLVPRVGHRGVLWASLRFRGRTAHASMPHEGDNAVLKAARAAIGLATHDFGGIAHPVLGRPTLNVGRLEGGLNLNSVPDSALLGIDLRTVPGLSSEAGAGGVGPPLSGGRDRAPGRLPALVERARCGVAFLRGRAGRRHRRGGRGAGPGAVRDRCRLPHAGLWRAAHRDHRAGRDRTGAQDRRMVLVDPHRPGDGTLCRSGRGMVPLMVGAREWTIATRRPQPGTRCS